MGDFGLQVSAPIFFKLRKLPSNNIELLVGFVELCLKKTM